MEPVPIGVTGELHIGGVGVGRGYINAQELTSLKFLPNPFAPGRIYKTGDMCKWLKNGEIECLGRLDFQVKLRGIRMELGEIEEVMCEWQGVEGAVVMVREITPGKITLVGFVAGITVDTKQLKDYMASKLPSYMLPSLIVNIPNIPTTNSGKIDRTSLKAIKLTEDTPVLTDPPKSHLQRILVQIWAEVLSYDPHQISINSNFFELGGNSLIATQVASRILTICDIKIPVRLLFQYNTISSLAQHIESSHLAVPQHSCLKPPILPNLIWCNKSSNCIRKVTSFAQERMWILHSLQPGPHYNSYNCYTIHTKLDINLLHSSLNSLVQRHLIFRTTYEQNENNTIQCIHDNMEVPFEVIDLSVITGGQPVGDIFNNNILVNSIQHILSGSTQKPFDLVSDCMIRCTVIKLDNLNYIMALCIHHIATDGWSMNIIERELSDFYQGRDLKPLVLQYADFAEWQRGWLQGDTLEQQSSYWLDILKGDLPILQLPTDRPRPPVMSYKGSTMWFEIPSEVAGKLKDTANILGVSLFSCLLSCFVGLLHRFSGQDDIIVGFPVANRNMQQLERIVGFFVNTLVIRADFSEDPKWTELISRVNKSVLEGQDHQDMPFDELLKKLKAYRSMSTTPIFQAMFTLLETPSSLKPSQSTIGPGLDINQSNHLPPGFAPFTNRYDELICRNVARFDVVMGLQYTGSVLSVALEYNKEIFDPPSIHRLLQGFLKILECIVSGVDTRVSECSLIQNNEEKQNILYQWNNNDNTEWPSDKCAHELFSESASMCPDEIAIVYGESDTTLSYRELDEKSNRLSQLLISVIAKSEPTTFIGICVNNSSWLTAGCTLAVWKTGKAYVPLDPKFPAERLGYMLTMANISIVICQTCFLDKIMGINPNLRIITVDEVDNGLNWLHLDTMDITCNSTDLSHLIYTSGSTGLPKGVAVEHQSIVNFGWHCAKFLGYKNGSRIFQSYPYSFDGWLLNSVPSWTIGGTLYFKPEGVDVGEELRGYLTDHKITSAVMIPSRLATLEGYNLPYLTLIGSGGDTVSLNLLKYFSSKGCRVINMYGPTETAIACMWSEFNPSLGRVTIGKPIPNLKAYVLDKHLEPVPVGVQGELYIGGIGVARGYYNNPELTLTKYIPNPFTEGRVYKTGDIVRWLNNGEIEFIGRADSQVKLRGLRIELSEIEATICEFPGVDICAVMVKERTPGRKVLVSYVCPTTIDKDKLKEYLISKLPSYSVPQIFILMDEITLNSNGKVNRKDLPELSTENIYEETSEYPANEIELKLQAVCSEVLGIDKSQISTTKSFFEIGGDSIMAMLFSSKAKAVGLHITPKQIFEKLTIKGLASVCNYQPTPLATPHIEDAFGNIPLTPIQTWFFNTFPPATQNHLNQAFLLATRKLLNCNLLDKSLNVLISQHDMLRARYVTPSPSQLPTQVVLPDDPSQHDIRLCSLITLKDGGDYTEMIKVINDIQDCLNIEKGPLLQAVLFEWMGHQGEKEQRLFLVIHHLVVDGVSWRILIDDLETTYQQLESGSQNPILPPKSTPFRIWADNLSQLPHSEKWLAKHKHYWDTQTHKATAFSKKFPIDMEPGLSQNTMSSERFVVVEINEDQTRRLLSEVHSAYHTQINDILITAFGEALCQVASIDAIEILLEGHGRENLFEGAQVDISRTVGWFTTQFPVLINRTEISETVSDIGHSLFIGRAIMSTKETLREIPQKGIGYGVLGLAKSTMNYLPDISFNYLGQFKDNDGDDNIFWMTGQDILPLQDIPRTTLIGATGIVLNGKLRFSISYSQNIHFLSTIEKLGNCFKSCLEDIIGHCISEQAGGYTPSDFPLLDQLTQHDFDEIILQALPYEETQYITPTTILTLAPQFIEDIYPLSPVQKGLLFHSLMDTTGGDYHCQMLFDMIGETFQIDKLKCAFEMLMIKHPMLRTKFLWQHKHKDPLQVVMSPEYFDDITTLGLVSSRLPFKVEDWSSLPTHEQLVNLDTLLKQDRERGFEPSQAPLIRLCIIHMGNNIYTVVFSHHHLLIDGWSFQILMRDVLDLYRSDRINKDKLKIDNGYRRFMEWYSLRDLGLTKGYWSNLLEGFEEPTTMPLLDKISDISSGKRLYNHVELSFSNGETKQIKALLEGQGSTLNIFMLAVWTTILSRYSGSDDVLFGTILTLRPTHLNLNEAVGPFLNTVPMRVKLSSTDNITSLIDKIRSCQMDRADFEHAFLPDIHSWANLPKNAPLFSTAFVFENYPLNTTKNVSPLADLGIDMKFRDFIEQTHFPLAVSAIGTDVLQLRITYDTSRMSQSGASSLAGIMKDLTLALVTEPIKPLINYELLRGIERDKVLYEWNNYPIQSSSLIKHETVLNLYYEQLALHPHVTALEYNSGEDQLSYDELDNRVNSLANLIKSHLLIEKIEGKELLFGIFTQSSSWQMVGAILASWKCGAAYIPLDPKLPLDRLKHIITDSHLDLILHSHLDENLSQIGADLPHLNLLQIPSDLQVINIQGSIGTTVQPCDLAYVIYTSGSTGVPKGVAVEHCSLVNFAKQFGNILKLQVGERVLQIASFSFDAHLIEIVPPLIFGCTICLKPDHIIGSRDLADFITTHNIQTLPTITPSRMVTIVDYPLPTLRTIAFGGETLSLGLMKSVCQMGIRVLNGYGPTETTIMGLCSECNINQNIVGIGRPLPNILGYILDKYMELTPIGVPGEIYIGGIAVARGYINNKSLSSLKFLPNPFSEGRLYKTGDIGKWKESGEVEYIGRVDFQVKLRGFRIELGEIETIIAQCPDIKSIVVLLREDIPGRKSLVAYVAPDIADLSILKIHLASKLPSYMIPQLFVKMAELPTNSNGKIDRRALPAPALSGNRVLQQPKNYLEEMLRDIWSEILKIDVENIGTELSFFELGGDSLTATQLLSRIAFNTQEKLTLRKIFEYPTITSLAGYITNQTSMKLHQSLTIPHTVRFLNNQEIEGARASFAQERMWLLHQINPETSHYHSYTLHSIKSALNFELFEASLQKLQDRHEILRTTIVQNDFGLVQIIHKVLNVQHVVYDLKGTYSLQSKEDLEQRVGEITQYYINKPFDIGKDCMLRCVVITINEEYHILLLCMHHIITDGWSMSIILKELVDFYEGRQLDSLPIQYADFSEWQREWLQGEVLNSQLRYWSSILEPDLPILQIPSDRPRPPVISYKGDTFSFDISPTLNTSIRKAAYSAGVTIFSCLLSSFIGILHRFSGQNDIIVGTPIANRNWSDLEQLIGFFVNTIAIRTDLSDDPTFRGLVSRVHGSILDAQEHQDIPFDHVVKSLTLPRSSSITPIFQAMFTFQKENPLPNKDVAHSTSPVLSLDGLDISLINHIQTRIPKSSKFDITLSLTTINQQLVGSIEYNTDIFDSITIQGLARSYCVFLESLVTFPDRQISYHNIITEHESLLLMKQCQNIGDLPPYTNTQELFAVQARTCPSKCALVYGQDRKEITYEQLDNITTNLGSQIEDFIMSHGIDKNSELIVGIFVEQSAWEMVGCMLATWKIGAAYLPLSPNIPTERIKYMLKNLQVKIVLCQSHLQNQLSGFDDILVFTIPQLCNLEVERLVSTDKCGELCGGLACVIYTSGSTGLPKGVAVEHKGIINMVWHISKMLGLTDKSRLLQIFPFTFDAHLLDIMVTLWSGSILYLKPDDIIAGLDLANYIRDHSITTIMSTPSRISTIEGYSMPHLELIVSGGEILALSLIKSLFSSYSGLRIINMYGPTETTVITLQSECTVNDTRVTIGRPIANVTVYILDNHMKLTPIGVAGELHIGGVCVTRGYLNNLDLTNSKFIENPFGEGRIYKTGDMVRWLVTQQVEYIGRRDFQVKLRGIRIELGEIESVIKEWIGVSDCVVMLQKITPEKDILVGYVSPDTLNIESLKEYLASKLPSYMLPQVIMKLATLPMNINGKINRALLPQPQPTELNTTIQPPENDLEWFLLEIWSQILGLKDEQISINSNFFELGGHSLAVTQVCSRIKSSTGVTVPYRSLFEHSHISAYAKYLAAFHEIFFKKASRLGGKGEGEVVNQDNTIPRLPYDNTTYVSAQASFAQERMWILHNLQPNSPAYHSFKLYELKSNLDIPKLLWCIHKLVERHGVLRTRFLQLDNKFVQQVQPISLDQIPFTTFDLTNWKTEKLAKVKKVIEREILKPYDLTLDYCMLRCSVIRVENNEYIIVLCIHHIATDGWSMGIIENELQALYEGRDLQPLRIQYVDFAEWQRGWLQGDLLENQLTYWQGVLQGDLPILQLPADRPRPPVMSHKGAVVSFKIPTETTAKVKELTKQTGASLFSTLLSCFIGLLHRFSGQDDIIIGTPVTNRNNEDLEYIVGFFVNTLVIRIDLSDNPNITELINRVHKSVLSAHDNQDIPFDELVKRLRVNRSASTTPVFQSMFSFHQTVNYGYEQLDQLQQNFQLEVSSEDLIEWHTSKCDITMGLQYGISYESGLSGVIEYNTDIFDCSTIKRLVAGFLELLDSFHNHMERGISTHCLISKEIRDDLLYNWNHTQLTEISYKCAHNLFVECVQHNPDELALVYDGGKTMTYTELDRRSSQISCQLMKSVGDCCGQIVIGICIKQSSWIMVASMLAAWKIGVGYIPLDPTLPNERLIHIVKDSKAKLIYCDGEFSERLQTIMEGFNKDVMILVPSTEEDLTISEFIYSTNPRDLAYIIYTSGSTGIPKGVAVEHLSLVNFTIGCMKIMGYTKGTRILQIFPFSFDGHLLDILPGLVSGSTIYLKPDNVIVGAELAEYLIDHKINSAIMTPSRLVTLKGYSFPDLTTLGTGGEPLTTSLANTFATRNRRVLNMYGPTETTVVALCRNFETNKRVSIGKPLPNILVYVLDKYMEPVPIGICGELHIGGVGVAQGYINNIELSKSQFIENPFTKGKLYKTGDMVRWIESGDIEYIGRVDGQVKLRGLRIELGEIETAMFECIGVQQAVAQVRDDISGRKLLVGYLCPKNLDLENIKIRLSSQLPSYMVPQVFVLVDNLKLNTNGKVDRKLLPPPSSLCLNESIEPPATELEHKLVGLFAEVLELEVAKVSAVKSFFELGGDSITAILLVSKGKTAGIYITLQQVYEKQTVRNIATICDTLVMPLKNSQSEEYVELNNRSQIIATFGNYDVAIAYIWQEVLGVIVKSTDDTFYELSGTAIQAAQVGLRIQKEICFLFEPQYMLQNSTVSMLSDIIRHIQTNQDYKCKVMPEIANNSTNSNVVKFPSSIQQLMHHTTSIAFPMAVGLLVLGFSFVFGKYMLHK